MQGSVTGSYLRLTEVITKKPRIGADSDCMLEKIDRISTISCSEAIVKEEKLEGDGGQDKC